MTLCPAAADTGIRFLRTDIGEDAFVDALARNVSRTARSTTISDGKVSVSTIEHVLSAMTGLGVDNVLVKLDAQEVPILDGSARMYAEAIAPDGLEEQDAERTWITLREPIVVEGGRKGSWIKIIPSDKPAFDVTIDFNSRVLGIQNVHWNFDMDYAAEVAPCRTFCFLHEVQWLAFLGLIKGGDVENAIVVVEKPVSRLRLACLGRRFRQPLLSVTPEGYLSNLKLRFPDECGRHKLLDLIGDMRLCGGFLKAEIQAYKPGHKINTIAALKVAENLK